MFSKCWVYSLLAVIVGTSVQRVIAFYPTSIHIERAEVERVRAGIDGRTIIVDWHGAWDYATIQDALDASTDGDTIIVLPSVGSPDGAYVENIEFPPRAVTLRSINPDDPAIVAATVIDGRRSGSVVRFEESASREASLIGFTIRNGSPSGSPGLRHGGGICITASEPTVARNTITGNEAGEGGGIYIASGSPKIIHNRITGNSAVYGGGGIYVDSGSSLIINNLILGNSAWHGGGIEVYGGGPMIVNNTIMSNIAYSGGGLETGYAYYPIVVNSIVAFNSSGICQYGIHSVDSFRHNCVYGNVAYDYSGVSNATGINGNISADPLITDLKYGNVHLQPGSPCVDAGTSGYVLDNEDIDGDPRNRRGDGLVDIGADEFDGMLWPGGPHVTIRVNPLGDDQNDGSSWSTPKRTVQAAIDSASAVGGDVWVAVGTYSEEVTLHSFSHVYGGFSGSEMSREERDWCRNVTTLDGEGGRSVVNARAGHLVSTLDGFTVTNGSAQDGGGFHLNLSSPEVANNIIVENSASQGGGLYAYFSSPVLRNNRIRRNDASVGGGIYMAASFSPLATITDNEIDHNHGTFGGGVRLHTSSPVIANNAVTFNSSGFGASMYIQYSSPAIVNNTIVGNDSSVLLSYASPLIANTIIALNVGGLETGGTSQPILRHSDVYGNMAFNYSGLADPTGTNGNISADPLFLLTPDAGTDGLWGTVDDNEGNVRLTAGSPCINTGHNGDAWGDVDLDGSPRLVGCFADMGAYEYPEVIPLPADFDEDCDVDLADYVEFQSCLEYSGPGQQPPSVECLDVFDSDADADLDLRDFAEFQALFTGCRVPGRKTGQVRL